MTDVCKFTDLLIDEPITYNNQKHMNNIRETYNIFQAQSQEARAILYD